MTDLSREDLSDSMEMYLVTIVRLREGDEPVPLSHLANALMVTSVSVNEMCRKLQDNGLLVYQPYKGVSLTEEGERLADHTLQRRRLWNLFLVERLNFSKKEADDIACELEHVTPVSLVERLSDFLGHPAIRPDGGSNDRGGSHIALDAEPLDQIKPGRPFQVVQIQGDDLLRGYLEDSGLISGTQAQIIAANDVGNILIETRQGHRLTLTRAVADLIFVQETQDDKENSMMKEKQTLDQLLKGQTAKVQKVNGEGPIRQRLLDMGLTRGAEVTMVKASPLGDPVEYSVRGYKLSLRKAEAKMIEIAD